MDKEDMGSHPYVINIEKLTKANSSFRVAKWSGANLQMTVMAIPADGEVGLEVHDDHDQFLRIEEGKARIVMGSSKDELDQEWSAEDDFAIFVPAGTWHNIINTGDKALKLYSIYAPPEHPNGTVHETFEESEAAETERHD